MAKGMNGNTRVTFVWEPAGAVPGDRRVRIPSRVALKATGANGTTLFEGPVRPTGAVVFDALDGAQARAVFEVAPGRIRLEMSIEDAAAFLLERTKDRRRVASGDDAKAREVAEELGGLALALEQAAAFIAERRLTFAQYLEQLRSKRDEVLAWFDPTVTDYPRSVAVTWQTSVAQLSDGGRRLLERLALIEDEVRPSWACPNETSVQASTRC
jgi:hypothetical protein